jgi:hypothetical protein
MSGEKLFTTWFTSQTDGVDHAVTDEAFFFERPAPTSICGVGVPLTPMTVPPGPRCARCTVLLLAAVQAVTTSTRHRVPGRLARLLGRDQTPGAPSPRALARRARSHLPSRSSPASDGSTPTDPIGRHATGVAPHSRVATPAVGGVV